MTLKNINNKTIMLIGFILITVCISILILKDLGSKNLNDSNDNYINGSFATNNDKGIYFSSPNRLDYGEDLIINSFFDKLIKFNSKKNEFEEIIVDSKVECIKAIDNWIYFVGEDKCIYKVRDDGTTKTKLSDNQTCNSQMYIDNDWIYFLSENDEKAGMKLYRVNTDGSQEQKILTEQLQSDFLVEDNILFYVKDSDNSLQLFRYDILNEEKTIRIENLNCVKLSHITKHGDSIYYICKFSFEESGNLYEYDLKTESSREILKDIFSYNIENDQRIYYSNSKGLFVKDLNGSEEKTIISTKDIIEDINIAGESIFYHNRKYIGKESNGEDKYSYSAHLNTVKKDGTELFVIDDVFNFEGNKRYVEMDFACEKFKMYYPINFGIDEIRIFPVNLGLGGSVLLRADEENFYALLGFQNNTREFDKIKSMYNSDSKAKVEDITTNEGLKGYIVYTDGEDVNNLVRLKDVKNYLTMRFITAFDGKGYTMFYEGDYDKVMRYKEMFIDTAKQMKIKSYEN